MIKKIAISSVALFFAFAILDYLMHNILLESAYMETAHLWRSTEEMNANLPWMYCITLIFSIAFSAIYALLISPKSMSAGIKFGSILGIASGLSMGVGSYLVMPITGMLATVWVFGTIVEFVVAGIIVAAIIKD